MWKEHEESAKYFAKQWVRFIKYGLFWLKVSKVCRHLDAWTGLPFRRAADTADHYAAMCFAEQERYFSEWVKLI